MKLNKFLWSLAALAALGLTACSSEHLADEPSGPNLPGFNEDGEGYLAVSLNLPATTSEGSRDATDSSNDQFYDGTADEYAVKSAMLLIFTGTTEATAVYEGAYGLSGYTIVSSSSDNVTEIVQKTVKIKGQKTAASDFWALAVLNYYGTSSISLDGSTLTLNNLGTTPITITKGTTTFATMSKLLLPCPTSGLHGEHGFLMTNAIVADKAGNLTGNSVSTLVKVTDNIKDNEADAQTHSAKIYVERVSAKVNLGTTAADYAVNWDALTEKPLNPTYDMGANLGASSGLGASTSYSEIKATLTKWALGNTNSRAYMTRQW